MAATVGVVFGSDSDWGVMKACVEQLGAFGVEADVQIMSAHRSPTKVHEYAAGAAGRGLEVIIAGAGMSAALAGTIAAVTRLPVIGVPIASGPLAGVDALLSTVQMPPGVPVAAVGIGTAGARNAAVLAVQMLAMKDPKVAEQVEIYKRKLAESVDSKNQILQEQLRRE